ncbi:MAG: 50S ribosomal protein L29, partial [Myxococcota bacterium]
ENPMKLRNTRRDLARAYSVLKEKLSSKTSSEKNK